MPLVGSNFVYFLSQVYQPWGRQAASFPSYWHLIPVPAEQRKWASWETEETQKTFECQRLAMFSNFKTKQKTGHFLVSVAAIIRSGISRCPIRVETLQMHLCLSFYLCVGFPFTWLLGDIKQLQMEFIFHHATV